MVDNMDHVGKSPARSDAVPKVTGQATFLDDRSLSFRSLIAKMLTSPYPHAAIHSIVIQGALEVPGVRAIVTGSDIHNLHGESLVNIPFLAQERVRYVGEPVAAVAAVSEEAACEALALIQVDYAPLPALLDPELALKEDAPLLHPDLVKYDHISAIHPVPGTNICNHIVETKGDVVSAFERANWSLENHYTTHHVQHAAIEPHGAIAQVDLSGKITLWSQNDSPHRARKELAQALNLSHSDVRVISGYVGGNFGGKGGLKAEAIAVALALRVSPHPVKMIFDREEVFSSATARVPLTAWIKSAGSNAGKIEARKVRLVFDCGAYAEKSPTIALNAAQLAAGPYDIENVEIEAFAVFTNKIMTGAMRGYGSPQIAWAYEGHTDEIARYLQMEPFELRRRNIVREGTQVVTGQRLYAVGMDQTLEKCQQAMTQHLISVPSQTTKKARGTGVACIYRTVKTPTMSAAWVKMEEDGSINILMGSVEVGQGVTTILPQIVAETLRVPLARISVSEPDTDLVPYDTSTTSSRTTFHMGNAVKLGAGGTVLGKGVFSPQEILGAPPDGSRSQQAYSTMSAFHSYATQVAEVEVDLSSGDVKVLRLTGAHDVGKAINPQNCRQQIEGAMLMGLGYALTEMFHWEKGAILNPSFLEYGIPTGMEAPLFQTYLIEKNHPHGPYGAKGLGEMALAPTAAAIANAVEDACGVRIRDLPITPGKILQGLRKAHPEAGPQTASNLPSRQTPAHPPPHPPPRGGLE